MTNYFISNGKKQKGPFTIEELKNEKITKSTLVWFEGCESWVEAGNVETLSSIIINTPPPIQRKKNESTSNDNEKKKILAAKEISTNLKIIKKSFLISVVFYLIFSLAIGGFQGIIYKIKSGNTFFKNTEHCSTNLKVRDLAGKLDIIQKKELAKKDEKYISSDFFEDFYFSRILVKNAYHLTIEFNYIAQSDTTYLRKCVASPESSSEYFENLEKCKKECTFIEERLEKLNHGEEYRGTRFDYVNIALTIKNILKFSFGFYSIKKSLLFFLVLSFLWIGGKYTITGFKKSKKWVDKYSTLK